MKTFICWCISKIGGLWPAAIIISFPALEFICKSRGFSEADVGGFLVLSYFCAILPSIVLAIITAIYAVKNFEEICSMGLFMWMSNTGLLDSKIKYFFSVLFQSLALFTCIVAVIIGLFINV